MHLVNVMLNIISLDEPNKKPFIDMTVCAGLPCWKIVQEIKEENPQTQQRHSWPWLLLPQWQHAVKLLIRLPAVSAGIKDPQDIPNAPESSFRARNRLFPLLIKWVHLFFTVAL